LNGAGIDQISFKPNVTIIDTGDGFIKVNLPEGEVRFQ
jgi:hypothetical protein